MKKLKGYPSSRSRYSLWLDPLSRPSHALTRGGERGKATQLHTSAILDQDQDKGKVKPDGEVTLEEKRHGLISGKYDRLRSRFWPDVPCKMI